MIACQAVIYVALSKDADSDLMPTVCVCVWGGRRRRDYSGSCFVCAHVCMRATVFWYACTTFPGKSRLNYWRKRGFFSSLIYIRVCMFVLLIHLRDAVWSVYPSREVLFAWACKQTHRCRCFTVSAPRYDSPLFHLPPLASVTLIKITQLCARRREPDDTIAHMQKAPSPFFSSISLRSLYLIDFLLSMAVL